MSEAFFQAGDTVTVRGDLNTGTRYGSDGDANRTLNVTSDMLEFAGCRCTIRDVYKNSMGRWRYRLKENGWVWADEMFDEYIYRTIQCEAFEPASPADLMSILGME